MRKWSRWNCVLLALVVAALGAVWAAPANARPADRVLWSDCLYDSPPPSDNTSVAAYVGLSKKAPGPYFLSCGSVRHIKSGHGFDSYTEDCIHNVLKRAYTRATSSSNSANDLITAVWQDGDFDTFWGYVVVSKSSGTIVTAYTKNTAGSGSGDWQACKNAFA